jgi:hypothetical protein
MVGEGRYLQQTPADCGLEHIPDWLPKLLAPEWRH